MKFWFQGKDIECMALTFFMVGVWHLMWWSDSWAQWCTCSSTARATTSWASWPWLCICVSPGRSPCNWSYSPLYVAWPACVDWFSKQGIGLCLFFHSLPNSTTGRVRFGCKDVLQHVICSLKLNSDLEYYFYFEEVCAWFHNSKMATYIAEMWSLFQCNQNV